MTKVRIFMKKGLKRSEKSLNLPLKMVRRKSEFSILESEFNSGSAVVRHNLLQKRQLWAAEN